MVDENFYGTSLLQVVWYEVVVAWLMHLFIVQVDYRLRHMLMHGSGYWYRFTVVYLIVIV
jgi:hypothetical protein